MTFGTEHRIYAGRISIPARLHINSFYLPDSLHAATECLGDVDRIAVSPLQLI